MRQFLKIVINNYTFNAVYIPLYVLYQTTFIVTVCTKNQNLSFSN